MFLFGFQKFIAPTVIKLLYYLGLTVTIFGGLGVALYALTNMSEIGARQAGAMIAGAAIGTPLLLLVMRFTTEIWLVLFEINHRLGEIRDKR